MQTGPSCYIRRVGIEIRLICNFYFVQELDGPAKEAGVTLFNEIGLDPGIDHMMAMQCIDEVHDKGGKVSTNF